MRTSFILILLLIITCPAMAQEYSSYENIKAIQLINKDESLPEIERINYFKEIEALNKVK